MEVEILDKTETTARLVVRGADTAFMNSLRRIMLTEVPVIAIDEAVVIENSSVIHDEILVHRLGLIPLKTDLNSYNLPELCQCKSELGCNLCRASLTLDVETTNSGKTIFSGELIPENPNIRPVNDKIPIVKLASNQRIKLEAYARLGKGKKHAKWQPVSVCAYKHLPKIELTLEQCDFCGKCVEICPKQIIKTGENGKKLRVDNVIDCALCEDCVGVCPKSPPAIKLFGVEDVFIFDVESTGTLPVEQIIFEALEILNKKVESFQSELLVIKHEAGKANES